MGDILYQNGQVPLQVHSGSEKIRQNDQSLCAFAYQEIGSIFQAGTAQLQKSGFDQVIAMKAREIARRGAHRIIGGLDPRAVGKDDKGNSHALLMYARIWWISSVL